MICHHSTPLKLCNKPWKKKGISEDATLISAFDHIRWQYKNKKMFRNTSFEVITSWANFFKNNYSFAEQSLRKNCPNTVRVLCCNCPYFRRRFWEFLCKEFNLEETKLIQILLMFQFMLRKNSRKPLVFWHFQEV